MQTLTTATTTTNPYRMSQLHTTPHHCQQYTLIQPSTPRRPQSMEALLPLYQTSSLPSTPKHTLPQLRNITTHCHHKTLITATNQPVSSQHQSKLLPTEHEPSPQPPSPNIYHCTHPYRVGSHLKPAATSPAALLNLPLVASSRITTNQPTS
ncbi:hypothetical protein Pcinc_017083 [Petrolisthes cinctipes]|uniref:Uncharacterized protein n=1 Tax=Petrolisthes cinctipes TaxID=88211 RepID=A0AAE1FPR9_PETCI|nr:hypothetical protein Pcinc_017083 [Petrolisthes cinctipes]